MPLWIRWRFVGPTLAVLWAAYLGVLHPWLMGWGATPAKVAMALPGDDLAPGPVSWFTRGITIEAPPSSVWPWIVQIGQDRAGFYSNTWLENLTGADIKERAEGRPLVPAPVRLAARLGWALAGLSLAGSFLRRRRLRPWLSVPVLFVLAPLSATADGDAALAGFLAIGITLLGMLALGRRWWAPYGLLAAGVLLLLLLAPDAYAAFGLTFHLIALAVATSGFHWRS